MSRVVLVAINGPIAGVVVLSQPRDGHRVVMESCALDVQLLSTYLRQLADLYGAGAAARWACASTEDAARVRELFVLASDGTVRGARGQLEALGRPVRSAAVADGAYPLAYRRAQAMVATFRVRALAPAKVAA